MEQVKFKGVPFFLNGREYIVPSLSLRQVRENDALLSQSHEAKDADGIAKLMDLYVPIIGMALRRNYPEVTDGELMEWLDLGNFGEAIRIVQSASGYERVAKLGEEAPAAISGAPSSGV